MMMLLLLLLFNLPVNLFGISCIYSEYPYELSLNEYNSDSFQMQIDSFPYYDYDDDNNEMCRIEIYVDYKSNLLIISFGDSFEWSQIDDGETRLDFLILFNSNSTDDFEIYNVLEYACYDYYQCEKRFLFNNIHWITQINYTLFITHLTNTIFNNSIKTENCFVDKVKSLECSSGICSGKYSSYHKNYLFECYQNSQAFIEVHITINMIIFQGINVEKEEIIRYLCKFNQCNNQILTDSLINIVDKDFQLSFMKDALILSYLESEYVQMNVSLTNSDDDGIISDDETQELSSTKSILYENLLSIIVKTCSYILINLILNNLIVSI